MADYQLAIVGGGIAGLSAALVAQQIGLETVVIDPLAGGGQLVNIDRIENYPGLRNVKGFDLGPEIAAQVMELGTGFEISTVSALKPGADRVSLWLDNGSIISARTVILAMGSTVRHAGIEGEDEFYGSGLSYCAVCDGPFFAGKTVVVAGGGDSAADEAAYLAESVRQVHLVFPEERMHAMQIARTRVEAASNIELVSGTRVSKILGGSDGMTSVLLRAEGDGSERELPTDGVFLYTGLDPNTSFLQGIVDLDAGGHAIADHRLDTSVPGVMAAGDIRSGSAKLLVAAAGDGASAAVRASQWLSELG